MADLPDLDEDDGDIENAPAGRSATAAPQTIAPESTPDLDISLTLPSAVHGHGDYSAMSLDNWTNAYTDKAPPSAAQANAPHHKASGPHRAMLKVAHFFGFGKGGPENDWQKILYAHARLNAEGQPVDESGRKVINLKDMDPEFGKRLAQTCLEMDAEGLRFCFISGRRTVEEQRAEQRHYAGTDHPVAGDHGPHVYGMATDIKPIDSNDGAVYEAFHRLGRKNGLEFVKNDVNHCQIADCREMIAQKRAEAGETVQAAARHPSSPTSARLGA